MNSTVYQSVNNCMKFSKNSKLYEWIVSAFLPWTSASTYGYYMFDDI